MASSVLQQDEDQFVQQMKEWSKGSFITAGLTLAEETGVLSAMKELRKPSTSAEIASVADCKPRYVQELLEKLVVAGVVQLGQTSSDPQQPLYVIPDHFWKGLKSEYISYMAETVIDSYSHDALLDCFKTSGPDGLSSSHVEPGNRCLGKSKKSMWEYITHNAFPCVPGLTSKLEKGIRFLDIGCNFGEFILVLSEKFPKSEFVGFDIDSDAIEKANKTCKEKGLNNVMFMVLDAGRLPADWSDTFDVVSAIKVIHDLPYPTKTCEEVVRVLKPGGITFFVDPAIKATLEENVNNYYAQLFYMISLYYCMPLSLAYPGSEGLGACIGQSALCQLYTKVGLSVVKVETMHTLALAYISCIKPSRS